MKTRLSGIAAAVAMAFASRPALAQAQRLPLPQVSGTPVNATVNTPVSIPGGMQLNIVQPQNPNNPGAAVQSRINWSSFDVANGNVVNFQQPNAQSSVLNTIFQGVPSLIQGKITANGIIYLINQNGIIFDRGSQVNVGGLVASALGLNPVGGATFFDGGTTAVGTNPAFSGYGTGPDGKPAQIRLLGTINATGANAQGSVMVFAPKIVNQGTINAPDGQVILAAGQKVWLFTNSSDSTMRGFVVEYTADPAAIPKPDPANPNAPLYSDASGVSNLGQIFADRGNVTLGGLAVNQAGVASASTATVLNGSVWLIAREGGTFSGPGGRTGSVTLAPGSVTQTPLDTKDTSTLSQSTPYTPANIHIEGQSVIAQGSVLAPDGSVATPGAKILSPGGNISLIAADPQNNSSATLPPRIFVDNGAIISAAGDWVNEPASANLLTIQVTSNQLADAPLQRGGVLQGQNVVVDINKGTPLFDISPFVGNIQRSIAEKAEVGGNISFNSQGDVILRPGSVVDVSGGGALFAGGQVATTKLVSNGKVIDIGQASPNLHYDAVLDTFTVNYPRWGVTQTFTLSSMGGTQFSPADVVGQAAGKISVIAAGGGALEGSLLSTTVAGRSQQASGKLPAGGSFVLNSTGAASNMIIGPSFQLGPGFDANTSLPPQLAGTVYLPSSFFKTGIFSDTQYTQQGFGSVSVFANDSISVPSGQSIVLPAGGALSLTANNIDIEGSVSVPSGSISLAAGSTSFTTGGIPLVTVGSQSVLSVRGQWINQTSTGAAAAQQAGISPQGVGSVNGGRITVSGGSVNTSTNTIVQGDLLLEQGSVLDAGGGGLLTASGSLTAGNGGTINLTGTRSIDLSGTVRAYALGTGGALNITAQSVRIGGQPSGASGELLLTPDRFTQGGFSQYGVTGLAGLMVASGTTIQPTTRTLVLDAAAARFQPTGADLSTFTTPALLPVYQRKPAGLNLTSNTNLTVEAGSSVVMDPQANLSLAVNGSGTLEIGGALTAPAGNLNLTLKSANASDPTSPPGSILIDSSAVLSAPGYFLQTPAATLGQVNGSVLGAGSISLTATGASIVVRPGALLDVSGTAAAIDIPTSVGGATLPVLTQVTGDAGIITMTADNPSRVEGTLRGTAQGQSAGGAFDFDFVRTADLASRRIIVGQNVPVQGSTPLQGSLSGGPSPVDAYVGLGNLAAGGFDKLQLQAADQIQFAGDMNVALARGIRLDAPEFVAAPGTHSVNFSAPQLAFGGSVLDHTKVPAAPATGSMGSGTAALSLSTGTASSGLIELFGHTRLPGFGSINIASAGDVRMSGLLQQDKGSPPAGIALPGSFWTSGNITITAAQVYPTTFTSFTLGVDSPTGSITFAPAAGIQEPVYSVGGSLTVQASTIEQGGVVKAPLGQLTFDASSPSYTTSRVELLPGSVTSVSADGLTIPYGGAVGGVTWAFDTIPVTAPPAKSITVSAKNVNVAVGATADLSGGGEILGAEFIVGPGGSKDFLAQPGVFAVIPGVGFAPSDAHIASLPSQPPPVFGDASNVYDSVYLSGGAGLPAGNYALLPGYYALLPGAYVVRFQPGFTDIQPGQVAGLANGLAVVSGYRTVAGTSIRESRTSGFIVQPGPDALQQAEYSLSSSSFFSTQAQATGAPVPQLPRDAGSLVLNASSSLQLGGTLGFGAAPGGASGRLDISSTNIAIVDSVSQAQNLTDSQGNKIKDSYLVLTADELTATNARLLIGASTDSTGTNLTVNAGNILVANDANTPVSVPELILAATGSVKVNQGSVLLGTGTYSGQTSDLTTAGPGALLRVASGTPFTLKRTGVASADIGTSAHGTLNVDTGAVVHGDRAVLLDATGTNTFAGSVTVGKNGTLDIGAPRISLGETAKVTNGLVLSSDQLAAAGDLGNLVLRSYTTIDLYGTANVGGASLANLTLRSGGLAGYPVGGANSATISAGSVRIDNAIGGTFSASQTGSGTLVVNAKQITVGAGDQAIQGFGNVAMNASESFVGDGTGSLAVTGNLGITASRITGTTGSNQSVSGLAVTLAQPASPTLPSAAPEPGAQLTLSGTTLTQNGRIDLPSGKLTLSATAGDLVLGAGSMVNASGFSKAFTGVTVFAPAGSVALSSTTGNVVVQPGAVVDVSAPQGGDAGTVSASAPAGTLQFQGTLLGSATAGNSGGKFQADANSLANLPALIANVAAGGFTGAQSFHARSGDITVGAGDTIAAKQVTLVADTGSITLNGTIDASGAAGGGRVELDAGNLLSLGAGSRILANGTSTGTATTDPYSNGGLVRVSTTNTAPGVVTLSFDPNATIDVSAGGKGNAGRVEFYTTRTPAVNASLQGKVVGNAGAGGAAGEVIVYANNTIDVTNSFTGSSNTLDTLVGIVNADYASFMGTSTQSLGTAYTDALTAFRGGLQTVGFSAVPPGNSVNMGVNVRPAVELKYNGSLQIGPGVTNSQWDLTQPTLLVDGQPGMLTIRTSGTLDIRTTIGLPNPAPPDPPAYPTNPLLIPTDPALFKSETVPTGATWSMQLVGGADLSSANRLAVQPLANLTSAGDVTLTVVPTTTTLTAQNKPDLQAPNFRSGQSVRVRTGTGDIEIAAGRNFAFVNGSTFTDPLASAQASRDLINASRAAVYTTGIPTGSDPRFLTRGGDVRIFAQGNATGLNLDNVKMSGWSTSGTDSIFNQINQPYVGDWLRRETAANSASLGASGWWVDRRLFSGGIGSFGGGDISIVAGQNVDHLSAMNASSAQAGGAAGARTLTVQGGGALDVQAGGNILGGDYLVSNNAATIGAGGGIGLGSRTGFYLIGESTDPARAGANLTVEATGDIRVQNLSNPTILSSTGNTNLISPQGSGLFTGSGTTANTDGFGPTRAAFFTYSPSDQASLLSVAGNIDLDGSSRPDPNGGLPRNQSPEPSNFNAWFNVAPPRLSIIALSGKVTDTSLDLGSVPSANAQRLFPSNQQFLQVLAGGDISNLRFETQDAVRSTVPSWSTPVGVSGNAVPTPAAALIPGVALTGAVATLRDVTPSVESGYAYTVIADGSIFDSQLSLRQAGYIQAGQDIDTVKLDLQNLRTTDVTVVKAGRDIVYRANYQSHQPADSGAITIDGLGRLLVQAGRNIDLGASTGIVAGGNQQSDNLTNTALPSGPQTSAGLTVIAGYTGAVTFGGIDTLFSALTKAGEAHDAAAGDAAVNALFLPQFVSQIGNINMFKSTINTSAGSGIDLLVPSGAPGSALGGNINAGLPVPPTTDKQIGILTTGYFGGGIRAFTQNDFSVNQSKVITQLGGDILAYTSNGSIDAGRGSKAALTVTGPVVPKIVNGKPIVTLPGVGSGIQTATYDPDGAGSLTAPKAGDVFLFAPRGTINAGEAGINSGGAITVFALQILNAQNITAQGSTTGLPIAQVGSLASSLAGASNAGASAAQTATESLRGNPNPGFGVSNISVEVICMGDSPCTAGN